MWMVGYNEGSDFNMPDYPFNGRKLRPLIPKPLTTTSSSASSPNNNISTTTNPRIHGTNDFFTQYHNLHQGIYIYIYIFFVCIFYACDSKKCHVLL